MGLYVKLSNVMTKLAGLSPAGSIVKNSSGIQIPETNFIDTQSDIEATPLGDSLKTVIPSAYAVKELKNTLNTIGEYRANFFIAGRKTGADVIISERPHLEKGVYIVAGSIPAFTKEGNTTATMNITAMLDNGSTKKAFGYVQLTHEYQNYCFIVKADTSGEFYFKSANSIDITLNYVGSTPIGIVRIA